MSRVPAVAIALGLFALLVGGCDKGGSSSSPRGTVASTSRAANVPLPEGLVGKPIPKFSLKDINDKTLTNDGLAGKVFVLDFWATWCGPCKRLSPILDELQKEHGGEGLVVIGVDSGEHDANEKPILTKEPAQKYAKEHGYSYTFAYAGDELAAAWKIDSLPTIVIADRKGVVRAVFTQFTPKAELEKTIKPLLAEK